MYQIAKLFITGIIFLIFSCSNAEMRKAESLGPQPTPIIKIKFADSFAYPISPNEFVTEAKDRDEWYNAQDFGENDHLGEDWNKNSGGNSDCGETVYAAGNGIITYAHDAGSAGEMLS